MREKKAFRRKSKQRDIDWTWAATTQKFLAAVRSIVEPLLIQLGFQLDEFGDAVYYDRKAYVVFFRSMDCKIQVYNAPREGSINCMIAPLDAANVFGLYDRSGKWQYLPMFAIRQGVPPEDTRDAGSPKFPTTAQSLESVRRRIEKFFPIAHDGILEATNDEVDLNEAVVLYLSRYPASNRAEFDSRFGPAAAAVMEWVRSVLNEAMRVEPDWDRMTLNDAGEYVEAVMRERHPSLTPQALEAIGNYYTFQTR